MGFDIAEYKIQGYLLANAEELIEITGRNTTGNQPQPFVIKKAISPSGQATLDTQSDLFNAFSNVNQVDFVADLPGDVRSTKLRPNVRIFKTLRGKEGKEVDLELRKTFNGDNQYGTLGSNSGVTVRDVEIVRLGGNPAEVDTNIKVTISLYATKLGHFFDIQKPTPILNFDGEIADLGEKFVRTAAKGVAWIDLLKINLAEGGTSDDAFTRFLNEHGTSATFEANDRIYEYGTAETTAQVKASVGAGASEPEQRIKLELGYGEIGDIEGYSQDDINKIKELVASQREVFYLSLTQHEINFNEDGTADITVSYIGSGGANVISRENDLLFDPHLYELELRANDKICELKRKLTSELAEEVADDSEKTRKALQAWNAAKSGYKRTQTMLLNNGLYGPALLLGTSKQSDLESMSARQLKSRVYCNLVKIKDMNSDYIAGTLSRFNGNSITDNYFNYLLSRYAGVKSSKAWYNPTKIFEAFDIENMVLKLEIEAEKDLALGDSTEDFNKNLETGSRYVEPGAWSNDQPGLLAQFVFLGDIFEVALEVLASNNRFSTDETFDSKFFKPSPDIIKTKTAKAEAESVAEQAKDLEGDAIVFDEGSFVRPFYFDPSLTAVLAQQAGIPVSELTAEAAQSAISLADIRKKRLRRVYEEYGEFLCSDIVYQDPSDPNVDIKINLADLPISLFRYKQWFIDKILTPRRTTLFFKDFIQLLMGDLVAKILSERYNATETSDREPPELLINRFNVLAKNDDFLDVLPQPENAAYNSKTVDAIRQAFTVDATEGLKLKAKQLTLLSQSPVVVNKPPQGQTRREADKLKNIPHITFGDSSNGILRSVNFQREDMPGLREARLFEGSDFHGPGIIPEKYNSTLTVVGTTAFKVGSIFYIDPAPLDLGYAKDFGSPARAMGLGGYYDVIRVTHNISLAGNATWETMLDTKWKSFGEEDPLRGRKKDACKPTSVKGRLDTSFDLDDPEILWAVFDDIELLLKP